MAHDEGWLAEHMLILKLISPENKAYYIAAAFPSACGKTNLAMLQPTIPGWRAETLGDDIAWMRFGKDGRLYAVNPEFGFFGVAPGTNWKSNPNAMKTIAAGNTVFTNVALTDDGDVWWEGLEGEPEHLIDWKGNDWTARDGKQGRPSELALLHADVAVPDAGPGVGRPAGRADLGDPVRRPPQDHGAAGDAGPRLAARRVHRRHAGSASRPRPPRARSARSAATRWRCCRSSATTSATTSQHWIDIGKNADESKLPKIFFVNWFRRGDDGRFLWPGFGENSRVLKWIIERIEGKADGSTTPIGIVPTADDLDLDGLDVDAADVDEALAVNADEWRDEIPLIEEWFEFVGEKLPTGMQATSSTR